MAINALEINMNWTWGLLAPLLFTTWDKWLMFEDEGLLVMAIASILSIAFGVATGLYHLSGFIWAVIVGFYVHLKDKS